MRSLPVIIACVALLASGCATLFRGTTEDLQVDSVPSGAVATLSDGQKCTTPCTFRVSRGTAYNLSLAKDGCESSSQLISTHLNGGGVVESLLLGGIIDFADGAVYDASPNPVNGSLQCKVTLVNAPSSAPAAAPAAASSPAAAPVTAADAPAAAPTGSPGTPPQ
jgi:hypothetical protein